MDTMTKTTVDPERAHQFLDCGRIAVVGASDDAKNFGGTILRSLSEQGVPVVAVNPHERAVSGRRCYPDVVSIPDTVDGLIVMVSGPVVLDVIRAAAARSIPRIWLFKGIGGEGAASPAAVDLCRELGIEVIPGACPLMFLDPVRGAHRLHLAFRHLNHSVAPVEHGPTHRASDDPRSSS